MNDTKETDSNKVNDERRKVVRNLLTGAGVTSGVGAVASSAWMEPVINTIVLPAHAQTTEDTAASPPTATTTPAPPTATTTPAPPTATTTPAPTEAQCCPYYFDIGKQWCYEDDGTKTGDSGPVPGGFSVMPWDEPAGCPPPKSNT